MWAGAQNHCYLDCGAYQSVMIQAQLSWVHNHRRHAFATFKNLFKKGARGLRAAQFLKFPNPIWHTSHSTIVLWSCGVSHHNDTAAQPSCRIEETVALTAQPSRTSEWLQSQSNWRQEQTRLNVAVIGATTTLLTDRNVNRCSIYN